LALAGVALAAPAGATPSADALIAEVYGGGGNSGATLTNDYVLLADKGSSPVAVDGWSVQYLPGSPSSTSKWQVTPLSGSIAAGGRYLVGESKGSGGTTALPTPDASGAIAMAAGAGTVALVAGADPLTCLTATDCAADTRVRDLVGYGTATVHEGSGGAPAPSNTTAAARKAGLPDTDDNAADFAAATPAPVNSKGETAGGGGGTPTPGDLRVHDIQGTTRVSPYTGQTVTNVPGVVTGVRAFGSSRGFWFQDSAPDSDPRTSEGLFVFTGSSTPVLNVGDSLLVSGKVTEYYPGGADTGVQSLTELGSPTWTVQSVGNPVPPALRLDPDTVPDTWAPDASGGNIEPLTLRPDAYALDFYEAHEGERVEVDDARVVGPSDSFNELYVTTKPGQNPTPRGGTLYGSYADSNSGRLEVVSLIPFSQRPFPRANVGDKLTGPTVGPLDYTNFGGYELQATTLGTLAGGGLTPEVTARQRITQLAVATYNVENLAPTDPQAKFDRLAHGVVTNLATPDILSLEEIQDNDGATDDGVVAADVTLTKFTDAIVAAGGPRYQWRAIDPVNDQDGGQPGGNIRIAFLFNPARVGFVDRPGGTSTTAVQVVRRHAHAALSVSPGRIDPASDAWTSSRKPLAGEFTFQGRTVFVIANHFNSKGGDQSLDSRFQPPTRSSETQRGKQAAEVNTFVKQLLAIEPKANIVALGDLNDFPFSPSVHRLTQDGVLTDLIAGLPPGERYSYDFQGNSQDLDHILTSKQIIHLDYDVVHVNAEFADQASDHDPQVVRLLPSFGVPILDEIVYLIDQAIAAGGSTE
jgi:predicted extracellular nuclease